MIVLSLCIHIACTLHFISNNTFLINLSNEVVTFTQGYALSRGYGSRYKKDGTYTDSIDNNLPLSVFIEHANKSMVVSSAAVRLPLCVLGAMSQGPAQLELLSALGLRTYRQAMLCYTGDTRTILSTAMDGSLMMVNKVYVNSSQDLNKAMFINTTQKFGIDMEPAIFTYYKNARIHINNWIDNKSLRRLGDTLDTDDIKANTSILVVNALYFKVNWLKNFNILNTKMKKFRTVNNGQATVPMMYLINYFRYYDDLPNEFYLVTMPLKDYGMSFTIVVPYKMQGLQKVLKKLADDPTIIQEARLKSKMELVKLQMPKFKMRTKVNLDHHLKIMGIRQIYNTTNFRAGLLKMRQRFRPLDCQYIALNKVKQHVFIEVDEYGLSRPRNIEDVYQSDIFGNVGYGAPRGVEMRDVNADHPFLFTVNLEDQTSYERGPTYDVLRELFTGVYYGPEANTDSTH